MKQLFERVKEVPLDQVVRDYFNADLKKSGHDFVCRCPIHDENTPSFHVYIDQNRWRCYGACAAGGSAVDLLLKAGIESDALSAARNLAARYGIRVEENRKLTRKKKALGVAEYAEFCALPVEFLARFGLADAEGGVEMPYKDEAGNVLAIRTRHALERGENKDGRFSWRKGDKPILYGLWRLTEERKRLVVVEGESDTHVLAYNATTALGVPGAGNFRKQFVNALLPFSELVLIQEPGNAGVAFIESIKAVLKNAKYQGTVRAVSLPEKDSRALWLTCKDKAKFMAAFEKAVGSTAPLDLYPPIPKTRELIDKLETLFARHVFFKENRYPLLLALWVIGTYFYRQFSHYGYLHIVSPVMRCAKTLLLDILSELVANSTGRTSNLTESVVFHLANKGRTFLVDELDNMRNQDREKYGAVMAVLNVGFQAGAKVFRMKRSESGFIEEEFDAYCPKAMAGLRTLSDTLSDRCFQIVMARKTAAESVDRFSLRRQKKELDALRTELKLWAIERQNAVAELYDALDTIISGNELSGLDDRFKDIVEPLLSIALFSDCEYSNGQGEITGILCALLRDMAGAKVEADDTTLVAIVGVLEAILNETPTEPEIFVYSSDLLTKTQSELPWIDSTRKLAGQLKKFGFYPRTSNQGKGKGYKIRREAVKELRARYLPSFPDNLPSYRREGKENKDIDPVSCRRNDGATTDEKSG